MEVRTDHGLSQAELATRAGVSRQWVSELESGKRTVEPGRALAVLSALDLAITFDDVVPADESRIDLGQILGEGT